MFHPRPEMASSIFELLLPYINRIDSVPLHILVATALTFVVICWSFVSQVFFELLQRANVSVKFYLTLYLVAPSPRSPLPSEKEYVTVDGEGAVTSPKLLPAWQDRSEERAHKSREDGTPSRIEQSPIEQPDIYVSVVIPAYNEEDRLIGMLEETVEYLESEFGVATTIPNGYSKPTKPSLPTKGYEILLVSDGSTDSTVPITLQFLRNHILPSHPNRRVSGPWTHRSPQSVDIPPGSIRIITLEYNRGKGGAVTHGLRHIRGRYAVFADADGASRFSDLGSLISACQSVEDAQGRGVAVGSRAHLTKTPAVVQRSALRNFLMHAFHLLLWLMTPRQTSRIRDTQCGFKLFSRNALPYIVPYMHSEGWIFDVEMLMLAEFAGIKVAEVPVGWREVKGSKLNIIKDSLGMAWGLALLRLCWGLGIYKRD